MSRQLFIPFTENEVADWRFVNRQEEINAIINWINHSIDKDSTTPQILFLHGQRRVGKSSIVKRMVEPGHLISQSMSHIEPIYIDFRSVSLQNPHRLAELIVQKVFTKLELPVPTPKSTGNPIVWLDHALSEASSRLGPFYLLLVLDEFDTDIPGAINSKSQLLALEALQAVISKKTNICWLLIVQDYFLVDPLFHFVIQNFPLDVPRVAVRNLHKTHAHKLIVELTQQAGFDFEDELIEHFSIPDQIYNWTDGNPYFIHVVSRKMIELALYNRRIEINQNDLFYAVNQVLGRPAYFSQFTENIEFNPVRRMIISYMGSLLNLGDWISLRKLEEKLKNIPNNGMQYHDLIVSTTYLEKLGIIESFDIGENHFIRIQVRLFQKWVSINWPYES